LIQKPLNNSLLNSKHLFSVNKESNTRGLTGS
jgi:hypothetical protein